MAWYDVVIKVRLHGDNKDMTKEGLEHRQDVVDRIVQELAASCIAEPEMVARVRTGRAEITGQVEGRGRAEALNKVMKWEMMMEGMLDVDMVCEMSR